jgi:hypothetical protein
MTTREHIIDRLATVIGYSVAGIVLAGMYLYWWTIGKRRGA